MPARDIRADWITPIEAAELLQLHPKTVERACRRGALPAQRLAGRWVIARADVEAARSKLRPRLAMQTYRGHQRQRRQRFLEGATNTAA
jgi:excisionase family DNA binding protein